MATKRNWWHNPRATGRSWFPVKSYNEFTPTQRMKAYTWLKAEYAAARRTRPMECDACTQNLGVIEPHSEDYSGPPFGDHIGQHGLCFTCHMIVHCRFHNPRAWDDYRAAIREGAVFKPFHGRTFHAFAATFLSAGGLPGPARFTGILRTATLLDEIEDAQRSQAVA